MEILMELSLLAVMLHCLTVQVWMVRSLQREKKEAAISLPERELLPEELEARKLAAEAQARYEQGFINIMSYDGMPAAGKEGGLR